MTSRLTGLAFAGFLALAACGDGVDAEEAPPTTSDTGTPADTVPAAPATNSVTTSMTDLGTALVDPNGFTMYAFTNDTGGESTCYDECAELWPPVPGDAPIGEKVDASLFGTTTRADGGDQLTVNGQPLYLYAVDESPGDVTGQDFNGVWFVVGADGVMIDGPEPASQSEDGEQERAGPRYDYGD